MLCDELLHRSQLSLLLLRCANLPRRLREERVQIRQRVLSWSNGLRGPGARLAGLLRSWGCGAKLARGHLVQHYTPCCHPPRLDVREHPRVRRGQHLHDPWLELCKPRNGHCSHLASTLDGAHIALHGHRCQDRHQLLIDDLLHSLADDGSKYCLWVPEELSRVELLLRLLARCRRGSRCPRLLHRWLCRLTSSPTRLCSKLRDYIPHPVVPLQADLDWLAAQFCGNARIIREYAQSLLGLCNLLVLERLLWCSLLLPRILQWLLHRHPRLAILRLRILWCRSLRSSPRWQLLREALLLLELLLRSLWLELLRAGLTL